MAEIYRPGKDPNNPDTVPERTSGVLSFSLKDPIGGQAVPGSAVTTATLTIINGDTKAVVVAEMDVASKFNSTTGEFLYILPYDKMTVSADTDEYEDLIGKLVAEFDTGSGSIHIEASILVRVVNQQDVS